jgi:hypothetical protein
MDAPQEAGTGEVVVSDGGHNGYGCWFGWLLFWLVCVSVIA